MQQSPIVNAEFCLNASGLDFSVGVRLRSWGDRWIAVAEIGGEPEIGLGRTARQALEGALSTLGQRVANAFLSDPSLLAASVEVASQERAPA